LPERVQRPLRERADLNELLEVVLDIGRPPEARLPGLEVHLDAAAVEDGDLQHVVRNLGAFGDDNRAGIERTLHRFSAIRNRRGKIIGITCRVGRAVYGTLKSVSDLIATEKSILLLGRPGVGKTTMLREVARVLADDARKRVIVVDTSNEIAGDGDIPHHGIGQARRMQVPTPALQHDVMIEAVENHMPEVIIIDEMGTEREAEAARTIAERGVQLVATAHGNTLENLVMNPTLADLVGGVQTVILGDDEARRRRTQKSVLERKRPPTFDIVVEIRDRDHVAVHADVAAVVDDMLRGVAPTPEDRRTDVSGTVHKSREVPVISESAFTPMEEPPSPFTEAVHVYPFGVSRATIEQAIRTSRSPVDVVDTLDEAHILLTTKSHYRRGPQAVKAAEAKGTPVHVLRKNSPLQIAQFVRKLARRDGGRSLENALQEAQDAVERVWEGDPFVELMNIW
jgi:stage III sporulation protein SpoIIIAA